MWERETEEVKEGLQPAVELTLHGRLSGPWQPGEGCEGWASQVWTVFSDRVLPRQNLPTDAVRVEFWPDSGRIILFPHDRAQKTRVDTANIVLVWEGLQAAWNRFEEAPEEDADALEREIADLEIAAARQLQRAFRLAAVAGSRELVFFSYEEEIHL